MSDQPINNTGEKQKIEDSFDIIGLLLDYLSHWKIFLLCIILGVVGAYCYIKTIVPVYTVGASVYINDDNTTNTKAVSFSSRDPLVDIKKDIDETEIEIMKSRNSMMKIVDSLDLSYAYEMEGSWRNNPIYKTNPIAVSLDSADLWNIAAPLNLSVKKSGEGVIVKINPKEKNSEVITLESLPDSIDTPIGRMAITANDEHFNDFNGNLLVTISNPNSVAAQLSGAMSIHFPENSTTILNFSYPTPLPELGKDILQTLIYFYNQQIIEDKNRSAIQTEAFIIDRLMMISDELRDVENRLKDYRQTHQIANQDAQIGASLTAQSSSEAEIASIATQERILDDLKAQVNSIQISGELPQISTIPTVSDNPIVSSSIQQFNDDVRKYNNLRRDMTAENESVNTLLQNLKDQRSQILSNITVASKSLAERRRSASSREVKSTSQLAAQPAIDKGLQEIFREQSVKVNIYTYLLQKREEIAIQKTLATPTAQFIDNPSVTAQQSPRPYFIYIIGLVIGFGLPALLIFLKRLLFPKFKEKEDIERITTVPILGEICKTDGKSEIVVGENLATPVAEMFRLLRNNINFIKTEGQKKVILVTSAVSGEGKTFIALNLALTYALTGKRVALMGLDIRRPVLAHKLGVSNQIGATTYLSGQVNDVNDIILPSSESHNLFIVPAGPVPPNPNELLLGQRMTNMFNALRNEFDYIIIDSAPIGLVSDTFLIIPHSDIQVFVTRASYTNRKGIKVLHDAVNNDRLPKPYIILNSVNTRSALYNYRRYGYYGYGNSTYGYGYGHYGNSKHHKKKPWYKRIFKRKK